MISTSMQIFTLLFIISFNLRLFSSRGVAAFEFDFLRSRNGNSNFAPDTSDFGRYIGFADDIEDNAGFTSDAVGGGGSTGGANPVGTRRLIQPPPLKRAAGMDRGNAAIYRWLLSRQQSPYYHLPKM
jgi:hypothetical protein